MRIFNLFRRKAFKPEPKSLRMDGASTPVTPVPDDAELAAQALLEVRIYGDKEQRRRAKDDRREARSKGREPAQGTPEYYRELSGKVRESREEARCCATRYVAYAEECLSSGSLPEGGEDGQPSGVAGLEQGLYRHQDTVEREGGGLLRRWQKCLAECIVREMAAAAEDSPSGDSHEKDGLHLADGTEDGPVTNQTT